MPQPPLDDGNLKEDLPIVDLTESAATILSLLCFAYPAINPTDVLGTLSLSQITDLLHAAVKYDIEGLQTHALKLLIKPHFIVTEPLRIYAIACRFRAEKEARMAAKQMLCRPLLTDQYIDELEMIDAGSLYRLQSYHKRCTEAAAEVARGHTWIRTATYTFFECKNHDGGMTTISPQPSRKYPYGYHLDVHVHGWWLDFMEKTRLALSTAVAASTVTDLGRVMEAAVAAGKCPECQPRVASDFHAFVRLFAEEVEDRISQIELELRF